MKHKTQKEISELIEEVKKLRLEGFKKEKILDKLNITEYQYRSYVDFGKPGGREKRLNHYAKYRTRKKAEPFYTLKNKLACFFERGICDIKFTYLDVLNKFGENPKCYLSGKLIDYNNGDTYQLDHVVSIARGGKSNLDNLQLIDPKMNRFKNFWSLEELVEVSKLILENVKL